MQKRCLPCNGSGKMMGGGMLTINCEHCHGVGKIEEPEIENELDYLQMQSTESFKKAIANIKALDKNITDDEAEKVFKSELYKLRDDKLKPHRGRPRKES